MSSPTPKKRAGDHRAPSTCASQQTLGRRLRETRRARGLTQGQLAVRLHVTRQAVSRWEVGQTVPDVANLARAAEVLGCTVDGLLGNESAPLCAEASVTPSGDGGAPGADAMAAPAETCREAREPKETPEERRRIERDRRTLTLAVLLRGALLGIGLSLVALVHDPVPRPDAPLLSAGLWLAALLCCAGIAIGNRRYFARGGSRRIVPFDVLLVLSASIAPHALGATAPVCAACCLVGFACAFCSARIMAWRLLYQEEWRPLEDLRHPFGRKR